MGKIGRTGTGDRLAIPLILHVSGREDSVDIGVTRAGLGHNIALGIGVDLALDQRRGRIMTDGVEQAIGLQLLLFSRLHILDGQMCHQAPCLFFALDPRRHGVVAHRHFGVSRQPLGHRFARSQRALSHQHRHVAAVFSQEHGFFGGGVATADDDERFVSEDGDGAIADGAGADAVLPVFVLAWEVEAAGGGAGGDDDGVGGVGGVGGAVCVFAPEFEGPR